MVRTLPEQLVNVSVGLLNEFQKKDSEKCTKKKKKKRKEKHSFYDRNKQMGSYLLHIDSHDIHLAI